MRRKQKILKNRMSTKRMKNRRSRETEEHPVDVAAMAESEIF